MYTDYPQTPEEIIGNFCAHLEGGETATVVEVPTQQGWAIHGTLAIPRTIPHPTEDSFLTGLQSTFPSSYRPYAGQVYVGREAFVQAAWADVACSLDGEDGPYLAEFAVGVTAQGILLAHREPKHLRYVAEYLLPDWSPWRWVFDWSRRGKYVLDIQFTGGGSLDYREIVHAGRTTATPRALTRSQGGSTIDA